MPPEELDPAQEPENPEQPEQPQDPAQEPENPEDPENPESPEQPEDPESPEQPEDPAGDGTQDEEEPPPVPTPYAVIFNAFLLEVKAYEMLEVSVDVAEASLLGFLLRAISDIEDMVLKVGEIDLAKRDDVKREFEDELPLQVRGLLVTGMIYYWLHQHLFNTENMRNVLNTRDFSQYAPHNMLFRLRELDEQKHKQWLQAQRIYAQRYSDIARLGDLRDRI